MKPVPEPDRPRGFPASMASKLFGLVALILRSAEGITRLSARVHLQFSHVPWLGGTGVEPRIDHAPFPYRIVHSVFRAVRGLTGSANRFVTSEDPLDDSPVKRVTSILNGIVGDRLEEWDNPLAVPMQLLDEEGSRVGEPSEAEEAPEKVVVFLHGLCMTERDWQGPAFEKFLRSLREENYVPRWLSYNTGRSIPANGRAFHELLVRLDRRWPEETSLVLIGHSMGGLVIRSALRCGRKREGDWTRRVTHAAYLGSPHFGAPLERIGYHANSLLGLLPFLEPFKVLGKIRSQGIQDLRYGTVGSAKGNDEPQDLRLPDGPRHLLIGSSLNKIGKHTPLGDGLVPLSSSLGYDDRSGRNLSARRISRAHIEDCGHIELLSDRRVYEELESWLQGSGSSKSVPSLKSHRK